MPSFVARLSEAKQEEFAALALRHQAFGVLALLLASDDHPYTPDFELPLRQHLNMRQFSAIEIPVSVLDAISYRDLSDAVLDHSQEFLRDFDAIISK